ncbi:MAG TPA: YggS family pyridoxal phosphate-dependent enzyme [Candidatus Bathyarchaeia archaeon]|nr:YggS family pyridoxal phosphate-dependent enzyme [Candidatus Bathyarchaeia archaeon]
MTPAARRLQEVRYRIAAACARARRAPSEVTLVAVTKTVPVERIADLVAAGHRTLGENRVQEALGKIEALGPGPEWHLVGHLQRNKARASVGRFALIHSVDDLELARELDRRASAAGLVQKVLLQANLAEETSKHGAAPSAVVSLAEGIAALAHLDLRGVMIIPPPAADPEMARPWFRRLSELRDVLAGRLGRPLPELSMGMSDDFEAAVEEGATLVRVGRALFGERG